MIIKKDSEIVKAKGEIKSLALKAKKESSDKECSTFGSEEEEYARSYSREEVDLCGDLNHLIGECPKPPKDKNQRAFVGGSLSDSGEEDDEKNKDKTCLVAQESNEGTIGTLESGLLALEGDARDFGVGRMKHTKHTRHRDHQYISHGTVTITSPTYTPASTAQKYLSLVNQRKLRPRRTPLKFESPMIAYSRKFVRSIIPPPSSTTTAPVTTMLVPMTTNEPSKDTIHTHLDALDAAQETGYTEDDLQFKRIEKRGKSNFDLLDLSKIKRKDKYLIYTTFENNKTECYLDCLRKGMRCETRF
ncbi:hypothetical protein Tco_0559274 [Tanacetum coccineum]